MGFVLGENYWGGPANIADQTTKLDKKGITGDITGW